MRKIITPGNKWVTTCKECKCKFSYEEEDIENEYDGRNGYDKYVYCPQCGTKLDVTRNKITPAPKQPDEDTFWEGDFAK